MTEVSRNRGTSTIAADLGGAVMLTAEQREQVQRGLAPNTALDRAITRLGANATPGQIAQALERSGKPAQISGFIEGVRAEILGNVANQNFPKPVGDLIEELARRENTPSGIAQLGRRSRHCNGTQKLWQITANSESSGCRGRLGVRTQPTRRNPSDYSR